MVEQLLGRFGGELDPLAQHLDVVVVALMLPSQIGVTRDLLQHRIQFRGSGGDPLQILLIQHKGGPRQVSSLSLRHAQKTPPKTAKTAIAKEPIVNIKWGSFTQHGSCPCQGSSSIGIARKFYASGEDLSVNFRNGFLAGLIVAVCWGVYLARLWQPERQLNLHNVHLLEEIEKHDWKAVGDFVDKSYQDRWGHDRALLLEHLPQIFRALPKAQIQTGQPVIRTLEGRGYWTAKITIQSSGEFADYVTSRINSLDEPFEFEWKRSGWPWNWTLVSVRNSTLEIPSS